MAHRCLGRHFWSPVAGQYCTVLAIGIGWAERFFLRSASRPRLGQFDWRKGRWPPPGNTVKTAAAGFKPTAFIKMRLSCVAKHQADAGLLRGSRWRGLPLRHLRFLRLLGHSQLPFRLRTEVGRRQDFSEGVSLLFGVLRVGSCHKHMNQWLIEAMFKVRCR